MDADRKGVRVVIVEDDDDVREGLCNLLESFGHLVRTAADSSSAMALIDAFRPVVVVLDLGLPDAATGLRLAAWLQSRYGPTIVLVVVTGCRSIEDLEQARLAGADYILVKPIDIDQLNTILRA